MLFALLLSAIVGTNCSTNNDCEVGFICASNGTCASPNQAIAACRCPAGASLTCDCFHNNTPISCPASDDLGGNDGVWKNCSCKDSGNATVPFEASLRLVFRWEPADRVQYRFAVPASGRLEVGGGSNINDDAAQPDNATASPIRAALKNAMAQWSERDCGGGKKAVLKITKGPDLPMANACQIQLLTDNGNPVTCTSYNGKDCTGASVGGSGCVGTAVAQFDQIKNLVGFLSTRNAPDISPDPVFPSGAGILASTPVEYSRTKLNPSDTKKTQTGRITRARTWFNTVDYKWRVPTGGAGNTGCASGSSGCYDLQTIAVHEFGHFMGYQHSSCGASVMYGTAETTTNKRTLEPGDVESLCGRSECIQTSGYPSVGTPSLPPLKNRASQTLTIPGTRSRVQSCNTDAECGCTDASCKFKCINKEYAGFCQFTCTTDNDCPTGEACVPIKCADSSGCMASQVGQDYKYCAISTKVQPCRLTSSTGGGTTGSSTGSTTGSTTSGTGGSTGSATGGDTGDEDIPDQGGSLADFCAPCNGPQDCQNGICLAASNSTKVCSLTCFEDGDCGDNGTCSAADGSSGFCYPKNTACIDQQVAIRRQLNEECDADSRCGPGLVCIQLTNAAVCLEYCSPEGGTQCSTDGYDCVKIDNTTDVGVCFKGNMKEGDSCILPDTSLCGTSRKMLCAGTPEKNFLDAQCYKLCGADYGECTGNSQTCALYPNLDIGVCTPAQKPTCLSNIGEQCSSTDGEDCITGSCVQRGGEQACSRSCVLSTQSGCPRGTKCLDDGDGNDKGYCWPEDGKVKAKAACTGKSGCSCHEQGAPDLWFAAVMLGLVGARAWRRRTR